MRPDQLTYRYPVVFSIAVIIVLTAITEAPIQGIRGFLTPLTGRFYGDYLTDFILNSLGAALLLLAAPILELGQLGLRSPRPWTSVLLAWPLILLALLIGSEHLFGDIELVFDPALFIIRACLHLAIGFFEELLFRGYVQGFLMRRWGHSYRGVLGSVLLTNLIFGAAHVTNLLMGRGTPLYAAAQFGYAFAFGVFFSALYIRSGSIFTGSVLHGFFNFMSGLDAFAPDAQPLSEVIKGTTPEELISGLVFTLPLLLIGLFYLRRSKVEVPPADNPRRSQSALATLP